MRARKTALLSVSNKDGIADLARGLQRAGIDIVSTGGTADLLRRSGIDVTSVSDYTDFPEIMDGRVKTLHPRVHGGLLGRRGIDEAVMKEHGIRPIDYLVVNLYPFVETITRNDCKLDDAIETIDIGGPAMLRAAAKNFGDVFVVTDPSDYPAILEQVSAPPSTTKSFRKALAAKAFRHVSSYDAAIGAYLEREGVTDIPSLPNPYQTIFHKTQTLRYGENPHQRAAFYVEPSASRGSLATAELLQGKALSFNNIADADAALACVKQFTEPACVIVKHANPCGAAVGDSLTTAYRRAYQTDPTSAFGGIIALNRELDAATATAIVDQQFVEVIIAPVFTPASLDVLKAKRNLRALRVGALTEGGPTFDLRSVDGGLLVQDTDRAMIKLGDFVTATERAPTDQEATDLLFAWRVCKYVKSNAIVYAKQEMTIGIGAGQMSRIYSARIAAVKAADADLDVAGSVMASDAFFPFRDGIDHAAEHGVTAVIQPGGSRRDNEVVAAANENGLAMVFTGMRHFRH